MRPEARTVDEYLLSQMEGTNYVSIDNENEGGAVLPDDTHNPERTAIRKDLILRMSDEAKWVLETAINAPTEVKRAISPVLIYNYCQKIIGKRRTNRAYLEIALCLRELLMR